MTTQILQRALTGILITMVTTFVSVSAETTTSSLYSTIEQSVYQIRVVNKETGKKAGIGSGFVVSRGDILGTNYHVVSEYITEPDVFSLEYLSTSGEIGTLSLLDFDVVHDLAVVKADKVMGTPLKIAPLPEKGANLFSVGNPMDLGFSIVRGTNNGILKRDNDGNILFSGSLNPGMSGGPTVDEQGNVIGINVATSGNDISFLVPAQYLKNILARLEKNNYAAIEDRFKHTSVQLRENAKKLINTFENNASSWTKTRIGALNVPAEIDKSTRCWDASRTPKKDDLLRAFFTRCSNEDNIYLSSRLNVGSLNYEYIWMDTNKLHPWRFYRRYETSNNSVLGSRAGKRDVTNFSCHTDFTNIDNQEFKTTVCRRDYLKYDGLSDMLFTSAMVGHKDKGFIFNLDLVGTDAKAALKLFMRMLETFKWQN